MELHITQEKLSKALNTVARVASGRSTLPILSNVLLKIVDGRLSISATNLDIAVTEFVGAKIIQKGSITVPARLTQDFVGNLPNETIEIKQEDHKLNISCGNYSSTINGVAADEFPVMPAITKGETWTIPTKEIKKALQQTVFAASADEARPVLTGVYFKSVQSKLFVAATDSYRLAEKAVGSTKSKVDLLIPANAIQDLLRIIDDETEELTVTHDDQQVQFRAGDVELVARLIEGQYPDYRKLIPKSFEVTAEADKAELINVVKVSSLFARESAGSITLNVSEKDKSIKVRSVASQIGENSSSTEAKAKGDGEITLNSRYVLEGLQAIQGDKVTVAFNGKLQPVVFKSQDNDDYLHIVMPLKS